MNNNNTQAATARPAKEKALSFIDEVESNYEETVCGFDDHKTPMMPLPDFLHPEGMPTKVQILESSFGAASCFQ